MTAKFIKLTHISGDPIWFDPAHIQALVSATNYEVEPLAPCTDVVLFQYTRSVNETPEQIIALIDGAQQ